MPIAHRNNYSPTVVKTPHPTCGVPGKITADHMHRGVSVGLQRTPEPGSGLSTGDSRIHMPIDLDWVCKGGAFSHSSKT